MFWNQVKKKKKRRRESRRKKEKMRAGFAGMFLNEGEKEKKRQKTEDRSHLTHPDCVGDEDD